MRAESAGLPDRPSRGPLVVAGIAALAVWLAGVGGAYGWFTDELYFLACARHPALGYVDHPPLATLGLAVLRFVAGPRMAVIRLAPALAYAAAIVGTGRLARQLGGRAVAQTLAAALLALAPAMIVIAGFYSMNPFDVLFAVLLTRVALALAGGAAPRAWLPLGALAGCALLVKHQALVPAGLLVLAVLASPARAQLRTRWPYLGLALALALVAPNLAWLVAHDWITLDFYRESVALKNIATSPAGALLGQALLVGPVAFAVALLGAAALLARPDHRGFGAVFVLAVVAMMIAGVSRADRIIGLYPLVFAAGAVAVERGTRARRWLLGVGVAALALGAVPPLPLVLPVMPPDRLAAYAARLGVTPQFDRAKQGTMPQWLADKLGWRELAEQVAAVYATVPAPDRGRVVLFGDDYGAAGALALYGPGLGLPSTVISPHDEFWAWGPGAIPDPIVIAVGHDATFWSALFRSVERAGTIRAPHAFHDGVAIWLVQGNAPGLAARWPQLRRFE